MQSYNTYNTSEVKLNKRHLYSWQGMHGQDWGDTKIGQNDKGSRVRDIKYSLYMRENWAGAPSLVSDLERGNYNYRHNYIRLWNPGEGVIQLNYTQ